MLKNHSDNERMLIAVAMGCAGGLGFCFSLWLNQFGQAAPLLPFGWIDHLVPIAGSSGIAMTLTSGLLTWRNAARCRV